MRRRGSYVPPIALALCLTACYAGVGSNDDDAADDTATGGPTDPDATTPQDTNDEAGDTTDGTVPPPEDVNTVGFNGLRRLTAHEYDNTIRDLLLGEEANAALILPNDPFTPFDNDYTSQIASQALIEGADLLTADITERLHEDPARRDMIVGCAPASPGDEACLTSFITSFGRRALRRPLTDDEIQEYLHGENGSGGALEHALEDGDFYTGVDTFLRAILQDPQFLYRVELGTPVEGEPGLYKLDDFEVATRLSYLVWGSGPDDTLLDLAAADGLTTPDDIRAAAATLLDDPRALDRIDRFHAMWLGYVQMTFGGELAAAMRAETKALVERVVFAEKLPWQSMFSFTETFVDDTLATHYGLQLPGSDTPQWVEYDTPERAGLLSHGTFLSVGGKFNDTSPVQRGLLIRTRLFCQDIPPPPPEVDPDQAPIGGLCKVERYAAHSAGACAGCHAQIDPVGFGLESFDGQGRYRTNEPDNPDTPEDESTCVISGDGELEGIGPFNGPAELQTLALQAGLLDQCVAKQLYRFAIGRQELDDFDEAFIEHVVETVGAGEFRLDDLVLEFVATEAFGFRRQEEEI